MPKARSAQGTLGPSVWALVGWARFRRAPVALRAAPVAGRPTHNHRFKETGGGGKPAACSAPRSPCQGRSPRASVRADPPKGTPLLSLWCAASTRGMHSLASPRRERGVPAQAGPTQLNASRETWRSSRWRSGACEAPGRGRKRQGQSASGPPANRSAAPPHPRCHAQYRSCARPLRTDAPSNAGPLQEPGGKSWTNVVTADRNGSGNILQPGSQPHRISQCEPRADLARRCCSSQTCYT